MKSVPISVMALFCEDIREEVAGTFTIVGTMPDNLNLLSLPGVLPKLCVYIRVQYQPDADLRGLTARLIPIEGDPISLGGMEESVVKAALEAAKENGRMSGLIMRAYIGGFAVNKPGLLQVEVDVGGETYLAGMLNIQNNPV